MKDWTCRRFSFRDFPYGHSDNNYACDCVFVSGVVVLLQSGKAADLAGAFGGMGSQTVFGPRGSATVLSKATTIAAALFMVTSLTLSIMATRGGVAVPGTIFERKAPGSEPVRRHPRRR
jgi:protein translocase SecG subunit